MPDGDATGRRPALSSMEHFVFHERSFNRTQSFPRRELRGSQRNISRRQVVGTELEVGNRNYPS
jgi:hypothetical protein